VTPAPAAPDLHYARPRTGETGLETLRMGLCSSKLATSLVDLTINLTISLV